jgi:hypothetical protein
MVKYNLPEGAIETAKEVRKFIKWYAKRDGNRIGNSRDLEGWCAIASSFLVKKLKERKIKAEFVKGSFKHGSHCWIECENYIIDLTATQFSSITKKVFITLKNDKRYRNRVNPKKVIEELSSWREQKPCNIKLARAYVRYKEEQ